MNLKLARHQTKSHAVAGRQASSTVRIKNRHAGEILIAPRAPQAICHPAQAASTQDFFFLLSCSLNSKEAAAAFDRANFMGRGEIYGRGCDNETLRVRGSSASAEPGLNCKHRNFAARGHCEFAVLDYQGQELVFIIRGFRSEVKFYFEYRRGLMKKCSIICGSEGVVCSCCSFFRVDLFESRVLSFHENLLRSLRCQS